MCPEGRAWGLWQNVTPLVLLLSSQLLTAQKDEESKSGRQRGWVRAGTRAGVWGPPSASYVLIRAVMHSEVRSQPGQTFEGRGPLWLPIPNGHTRMGSLPTQGTPLSRRLCQALPYLCPMLNRLSWPHIRLPRCCTVPVLCWGRPTWGGVGPDLWLSFIAWDTLSVPFQPFCVLLRERYNWKSELLRRGDWVGTGGQEDLGKAEEGLIRGQTVVGWTASLQKICWSPNARHLRMWFLSSRIMR